MSGYRKSGFAEIVMFTPAGGWALLKQTYKEWNADDVPQMGAALAFYAAFSIAPLLVIALQVAAVFFGEDAARGEIERQMRVMMGPQGARAVQDMLVNANQPARGTTATAISLGVLLFAASGVFSQLQSSLNTIWKVKSNERSWLELIQGRFLSFAMVLVIAFLLLVSLVVSAVIDAAMDRMPEAFDRMTRFAHQGVSWFVVMLLFAMCFKILPDVTVRWRDVWLGAAFTSVLFNLGRFGIGWYLGRSTMASSYGLAGSFMVLLFWVFYSAQIFFLGAEMTQVYTKQRGHRVQPLPGAEKHRLVAKKPPKR
jgi:membrane protein